MKRKKIIKILVFAVLGLSIAQISMMSNQPDRGSKHIHYFISNHGENSHTITIVPALETILTIDAGPPGTRPAHMVPDSTGKLMFSLNHGGNFVTVFKARNGQFVKRIVTGSAQSTHGQGCQYSWSKDGRKLWVTELDDDTLVEIDARNLSVSRKVKVSDFPKGMVATEDKGFIYVLGKSANNVAVVRISDFSLVKIIPVGKAPHAGNYAGGKVYIGNIKQGEKSVSIIDAARAELIKTMDIGFEDPHFLERPVNNNNLLIVASKTVPDLVLIDTRSDKIVSRFKGDNPEIANGRIRHPMWHYSGKYIYFPIGYKDGKSRIYQLSVPGLKVVTLSQPAPSVIHVLHWNKMKNRIYADTEGSEKKDIPTGVSVYKLLSDGSLRKLADLFADLPEGEAIKGHHGSLN